MTGTIETLEDILRVVSAARRSGMTVEQAERALGILGILRKLEAQADRTENDRGEELRHFSKWSISTLHKIKSEVTGNEVFPYD
jgi:hypothetical protein